MRRDELLSQAIAAHQCGVAGLVKINPLSDRSRNGSGTRPNVPNRAIKACSSALLAVVGGGLAAARQVPAKQLRVWQSITSARAPQPSRPAQIRHRSVDHRSLGAVATEDSASMRGLNQIVRFFTCQPLSWKMRCTVFLLNPSRWATVR
jgi:hypothetical protein